MIKNILSLTLILLSYSSLEASWDKIEFTQGLNISGIEEVNNTLLISTSNLNYKIESSGILRSTIEGESWLEQEYFLPSYYPIYDLEKNYNNIIYLIAESNGIFISYDEGQSFTRIFGVAGGYSTFKDIVINKNSILLLSNRNIYLNIDAKDSVFSESLTNSLNLSFTDTLNSAYYDGSILYASVNNKGVYYSDDLGTNWKSINSGLENNNVDKIIRDEYGNIISASDGHGIYSFDKTKLNWSKIPNTENILAEKNYFSDILYNNGSLYVATKKNIHKLDIQSGMSELLLDEGEINGINNIKFIGDNLYISGIFSNLFKLSNGQLSEIEVQNCGLKTTKLAENEDYLFQGSSIGTVSRSSNNGEEWETIIPFNYLSISHITSIFCQSDEVVIGNGHGESFYSSNSGDSFSLIDSNLVFIDFTSRNDTIIGISKSGLYKFNSEDLEWDFIVNSDKIANPTCITTNGEIILIGTQDNGILFFQDGIINNFDLGYEYDGGLIYDIEYLDNETFLFGLEKFTISGFFKFDSVVTKIDSKIATCISKKDNYVIAGNKYGSFIQISDDYGKSFEEEFISEAGINPTEIFITNHHDFLVSFTGVLSGLYKRSNSITNIENSVSNEVIKSLEVIKSRVYLECSENIQVIAINCYSYNGMRVESSNFTYKSGKKFEFNLSKELKSSMFFIEVQYIVNNIIRTEVLKVIALN